MEPLMPTRQAFACCLNCGRDVEMPWWGAHRRFCRVTWAPRGLVKKRKRSRVVKLVGEKAEDLMEQIRKGLGLGGGPGGASGT